MMKSVELIKPYFVENRFILVFGILCLTAVDFLQLFIPRVIKWAVDDLTALRVDVRNLIVYALYIVGIAIMMALLRYVWRRCLIGTSRRVEEGLRNTLFGHIQTLSASYFQKAKTGDLMAHATNDINHIRMATGMGIVALTDAVVLGTAAIGFMAYINVTLTLYVLIPMPFIVFGTRVFTRRMHRLYQEVQASFADLTEIVRERFAGIRIIKAYNREQDATDRLETISRDYVDKNLGLVKITGSFFPLMMLFANLSLAIVLFLGGRQTIYTTITTGDFVAFISYLGLLTWPMMAMGWVVNLIQRGTASLDRINKILETRPEINDIPDAVSMKTFRNMIVFEHVTFSYGPDTSPVLTEIDLTVKHGQTLGIVGHPGSGKTTLLSLMPRIFDISQGRILIDDIDIRDMQISDLRSQISFMPQEPFLFAGTIRENIAFENSQADTTLLMKAADDANLTATIQSFPNEFETVVGEKGVILSGGQKQRIALARALVQETPILILDDPVSQVDMETGSAIINTIRDVAGQCTVFIVSHRISAVQHADTIIVLNNGRIVESGTHEELLEQNQYYAQTFHLQEIEEGYNGT
ncbi:MAG: ABC transporter ATP-binding protein/permease [Deltaproteobacteria bacterium]|nr:ABC transporter ATP-binding protein/permease [Deltaproteobacteria bacterium]